MSTSTPTPRIDDEGRPFSYRNTCLATAAIFGGAGLALIVEPRIVSKLYFNRVELRPFSAESWRIIGSMAGTIAALMWGAAQVKETKTKVSISNALSVASLVNFGVWAYVCASTEHDLGTRRLNALPLLATLGSSLATMAAFSYHAFTLEGATKK